MRKINGLTCLDQITPDDGRQAEQCFFLFHGYGADAYDLRSLADVIPVSKPTEFIFPQGVLSIPIGPGWMGRAWWPIDLENIQNRQIADEYPPSLPQLRNQILSAVTSLGYRWNQIILGGFSQGAMLATDLALHAPEQPKALVIFSGALLSKEDWKKRAPERAGMPFFMSHGTQDQVLPLRGASQLESLLLGAGCVGRLQSFAGGHEIPREVIERLAPLL